MAGQHVGQPDQEIAREEDVVVEKDGSEGELHTGLLAQVMEGEQV